MKKIFISLMLILIFLFSLNAYAGPCDALWENLDVTFTQEYADPVFGDIEYRLTIESAQVFGGSSCPMDGQAVIQYIVSLWDQFGKYERELTVNYAYEGALDDIPYFMFYEIKKNSSNKWVRVSDEPSFQICCAGYKMCWLCHESPEFLGVYEE